MEIMKLNHSFTAWARIYVWQTFAWQVEKLTGQQPATPFL